MGPDDVESKLSIESHRSRVVLPYTKVDSRAAHLPGFIKTGFHQCLGHASSMKFLLNIELYDLHCRSQTDTIWCLAFVEHGIAGGHAFGFGDEKFRARISEIFGKPFKREGFRHVSLHRFS